LPPECIEWTVAKLAVEAEKLQMKVTRLKEEKRAKVKLHSELANESMLMSFRSVRSSGKLADSRQ